MKRILAIVLMTLFTVIARAEVETITTDSTPWVASTWGYSTPKLLWDGAKLYAIALVSSGIDHDVARVYWRDEKGWHRGADLSPVYQPGTMVLDGDGHINVFTTSRGGRAFHWRSTSAGDVTHFDAVEMSAPEKFGYGYLGAGSDGKTIALCGLDSNYTLWISTRRGSQPWATPVPLVAGQVAALPRTASTYPIVMPGGDKVDIVFSNSPDGGIHNTYNRVEHIAYDVARGKILFHETIAEGPIGEMTFGLDALRTNDGSIHVLYFGGLHVYGEKQPGIAERRGLFIATLRAEGIHRKKISDDTGTAQLAEDEQGRVHALQTTSTGTRHFGPASDASSMIWDVPGAFLQVIKRQSGSVVDGTFRVIQTQISADAKASQPKYTLQYLEGQLP
jgi:hypothetical protein